MAITPARQRNAVSEGMALGLVMCGLDALPNDKVRIDLSFEGCWQAWEHRSRFPQVDADIRHGLDGVIAMTHADVRKQTSSLYWDRRGREIAIYPRGIWADGDIDVEQAAKWIDGGVPAETWHGLAEEFLRRFKM